jgi:hypothetical protein
MFNWNAKVMNEPFEGNILMIICFITVHLDLFLKIDITCNLLILPLAFAFLAGF